MGKIGLVCEMEGAGLLRNWYSYVREPSNDSKRV